MCHKSKHESFIAPPLLRTTTSSIIAATTQNQFSPSLSLFVSGEHPRSHGAAEVREGQTHRFAGLSVPETSDEVPDVLQKRGAGADVEGPEIDIHVQDVETANSVLTQMLPNGMHCRGLDVVVLSDEAFKN